MLSQHSHCGGNIMALINRVSRLFKADFHAVLDQIEEPEQLLKQAVRDMEDELAAAEQRIANCSHEQTLLTVRLREIQSSVEEIDEQLDLCFESGKDDLSRSLIRRKLEAERILKRLNARFAANTAYLEEQQRLVEGNRNTLHSLRQKAELFEHRPASQKDGADFDDVTWMAREMNVSEDEVEIAFLREKAQRSAS
jgi:phage shock protein A